ncbi:MAG: hypothetical protein LQ343_001103 [Gyalolechia ehrenbergii]|nr:MAG: hypothetical protein LQ343_001103 [Gyalolechia ehrenbergii]
MPSIRYYNQTAPFWDFIANLESTGANHPFFSAYNQDSPESNRGGHPSASPPPHHDGPAPPTQDGPPSPPEGAQPPPPHSPHDHPFGRRAYGGHGGRGGRRGPGGRCGSGPFPAWGGWGSNDFDLNKLAEFFASHFGPNSNSPTTDNNASKDSTAPKDFSPPADVFDIEESYIIHVSLPGAKKEDVGVNWDADKSELSVAGVIYRPGDEEFLKTLALDERQVGVFERKVRLGSRATPAVVDDDRLSAKMEDGVLVVTIPKRDAGYVEVKKVDIE